MSQRPQRPLPPKVKMIEVEEGKCYERRSDRTFRSLGRETERQRPEAWGFARICASPITPMRARPLVCPCVVPGWTLCATRGQRTIEPIEFATGAHRIADALSRLD